MFQAFRKVEIIAVFIGFFGFTFDEFGNDFGGVLKFSSHSRTAIFVFVDVFGDDVASALQNGFYIF